MDTTATGQFDGPPPVTPTCFPPSEEQILGGMEVENTVLALFPPDLPEATRPIVGAHLGVPRRIYDWAPEGAKVVFGPYLGQRRGDTVFLNLNGQPGIDSVQTLDENNEVTLHISHQMLLADVINRLSCTVKRGSANMGTSEPPLELLYNRILPGNQDTSPGDGEHSELELILSDALRKGVGPDFPVIGAQVCVSYPFCRAFDRIRLNLNGHSVYHEVTREQAPNPGSNVPVKVCFNVTRADLEKAGDHPKFNISYTVTDQLGNNPDQDSRWSAVQSIDVDLAGNRLPRALLREILNDPTDDPDTIDLGKLGANPLRVVVRTSDPRFLVGDNIIATYTAKVAGKPDVVLSMTGTVEEDEFGQKKPCVIQVSNDQVIAGSNVSVIYTLLRGGISIGNSTVAGARVIGEGLPRLLAPALLKSINGVLDPLDSANLRGATGRVEVLGYRVGDTVRLIAEGASGAGSPVFAPQLLNANSRANFFLNRTFIAANLGKQVKLSYEHLRGGKPIQTSPPLAASIGSIPHYHPELPTPIIGGVNGNDLDVTQLEARTPLNVSEWPQQVENQWVLIRYIGIDRDGKETIFEEKVVHAASSGLSRPVPLDWLFTLRDRSLLTISMSVNFYGEADESKAVKFPQRTYTVKTLLVEDFDDELSRMIIRAGEMLVTPVLTFKLLTTAVHLPNPAVFTNAQIASGIPGKQLHWYVVAQEKAEITFIRPCQKVSFEFYGNGLGQSFGEINFYGTGGFLGQERLGLPARTIEFSGLDIVKMELLAKGNASLVFDDFLLTL